MKDDNKRNKINIYDMMQSDFLSSFLIDAEKKEDEDNHESYKIVKRSPVTKEEHQRNLLIAGNSIAIASELTTIAVAI